MQLDQVERGFSYSQDAPLDMRMDRTQSLTAGEIINTYEPGQLVRILRTYGEEKFAKRIAQELVKRRTDKPWSSTFELVELIKDNNANLNIQLQTADNRTLNSKDLFFEPTLTKNGADQILTMRLKAGANEFLEYKYRKKHFKILV